MLYTNCENGYGVRIDFYGVKGQKALEYLRRHKKTLNNVVGKPVRCFDDICEKYKDNPGGFCLHRYDHDNADEWESDADIIYREMEGTPYGFDDFPENCNDILYEIMSIITGIIREETGIKFSYSRGQDSDSMYSMPAIMLPLLPPWKYSEYERQLTEESFTEILRPHLSELGIDDEYIGDVSVEYYE